MRHTIKDIRHIWESNTYRLAIVDILYYCVYEITRTGRT